MSLAKLLVLEQFKQPTIIIELTINQNEKISLFQRLIILKNPILNCENLYSRIAQVNMNKKVKYKCTSRLWQLVFLFEYI